MFSEELAKIPIQAEDPKTRRALENFRNSLAKINIRIGLDSADSPTGSGIAIGLDSSGNKVAYIGDVTNNKAIELASGELDIGQSTRMKNRTSTTVGTLFSGLADTGFIQDEKTIRNFNAAAAGAVPTTEPLSATDAGSDATINIAAFTMRFPLAGDVSYNSGSVTGLAFSTEFRVYFRDPTLAGGTVTFFATSTDADLANNADNIWLGNITTPANGAGDTSQDPGTGGGGYIP